jgi:hypothetical protein
MRGVVPEFRVACAGRMLPAVKRNCLRCGVEFLTPKAGIVKGRGKYCGRRCNALDKPPSAHARKGIDSQAFRNGRFMNAVNPIVKAAHAAVKVAIRHGELVRAETCSRCGEAKPTEAHHSDYSKPLDVVWLCVKCHRRLHRAMHKAGQVVPLVAASAA